MRDSLKTASHTFDLGQHVLEAFDDQSVLLVDRGEGKEVVQLDTEESYRLLAALQSVFNLKLPAKA